MSDAKSDVMHVSLGDNPSEWESSTLPTHSTKRLTVRVEVPSTLLQDALRTFYGLVCRYESYLSDMEQVADYTPWRDALIYALRDNGVEIDEQNTPPTVPQKPTL